MERKKIMTPAANAAHDKTNAVKALLLVGLCATANAKLLASPSATQVDLLCPDKFSSVGNEVKSGHKDHQKISPGLRPYRGDVAGWKKKNR
jgi:hypothetical protein